MGSRKTSPSLRCAATLFIVAFLISVDGAEIRHRDGIHRVSKTPPQVTPGPRLDKRALTACPASYSLCPPDLGGGCCAAGYACATESCYATTNGPVSCGGNAGYFACGADVGGKIRRFWFNFFFFFVRPPFGSAKLTYALTDVRWLLSCRIRLPTRRKLRSRVRGLLLPRLRGQFLSMPV